MVANMIKGIDFDDKYSEIFNEMLKKDADLSESKM